MLYTLNKSVCSGFSEILDHDGLHKEKLLVNERDLSAQQFGDQLRHKLQENYRQSSIANWPDCPVIIKLKVFVNSQNVM